MKLRLKQRVFCWLDSYDVCNENMEPVFFVKGEVAWGHLLKIFDQNHEEIGSIKERVMTFLPKFEFYYKNEFIGEIQKEMSFFKPKFHLSFNDWEVKGDIWEWEYEVYRFDETIMKVHKEIAWSDTYVLDIEKSENAFFCLLIVLAIDAIKCSKK